MSAVAAEMPAGLVVRAAPPPFLPSDSDSSRSQLCTESLM